jgi:hypothetical protein
MKNTPADHKWFTHLAVTTAISDTLDRLRLTYPSVSGEDQAALLAAKKEMEGEDSGQKPRIKNRIRTKKKN